MKKDIFGSSTDPFTGKGVTLEKILILVLSVITAAAIFDVIIHFDIFTGYFAACVADLVVAGVPWLILAAVAVFVILKAKWRSYRQFRW